MKTEEMLRTPVSQQPHRVKPTNGHDGIGGRISISINDKEISVPFGQTILEACKENQIHVPTLCHHPDLCIAGTCRICVVEVEGMKTLQTACSFPITSPIKLHTTSANGS